MGLFNHLKKIERVNRTRSYSRVVLVGLSWESLELVNFFSRKFGPRQVIMIDHKEWSEDHLFYPGPCVDRGEVSGQLLRRFIPDITLHQGQGPLFYKDRKFHSFGGRARPYHLLEGEAHYRQFPNFFDPKSFLDGNITGKLALAQKSFLNIAIKKITLREPCDLIEPAHFTIALPDHRDIECQYLFYGRSPREFLGLVEDRKQLHKAFIKFSSCFEQSYSLVATFCLKGKAIPAPQTFLIPQSQTHDRGHFILEASESGQMLKAHCRMSEVGEEEVSKKLRLLKRTLRRLFPEFRKYKEEKVYLLDYFPFCPIAEHPTGSIPHFSYFGWNAPLEKEFLRENEVVVDSQMVFNNARSLLSLQQIQQRF